MGKRKKGKSKIVKIQPKQVQNINSQYDIKLYLFNDYNYGYLVRQGLATDSEFGTFIKRDAKHCTEQSNRFREVAVMKPANRARLLE